MNAAANALVALIAILHVWIFVLESFLWQKPRGLRAFSLKPEQAALTAPLAKNQGVYNSFLAAGLFWSLLSADPLGFQLKLFFLACVGVAGLVGGATVSKGIFLIQALPAALGLLFLAFR
jgi:putative membrane protein